MVYLASPSAAYITGACLTVDGGFSLGKGLAGEMETDAVARRRDGEETAAPPSPRIDGMG